jgi:hypothetical protein
MGFFSALFDMSFSEFITTKLIKVLYVLILSLIGIGLVVGVLSGLATMIRRGGFVVGLAMVIVVPVMALILVIGARMWMETIIVLFRIAENTTEIADNSKAG